jgi:hypothetical protein
MKKDLISQELLKSPWEELAHRLLTKNELREAAWSEGTIKLHLGKPHGRHPSTHFRNPLGEPYWTGQQVVAAAVRAGYVSREVKDWPYQVPVHGLKSCGQFIMALENKSGVVMHPQVDEAMRYLVKTKEALASIAIAKPRVAEMNDLAEPGQGLGELMRKNFNVRRKHFPESLPEAECVDFALWVYGDPKEFALEVVSFADQQMLLSELQMLPDEQDVIDVLTADIESKANRFEDLDTTVLARLCGIEPADGDANRTTFAYWFDIEMQDELHQQFAEMEPYVSPKRFAQLVRWAERIDEMESEFEMKKLTKREQEVLALLWNTDGCSDRSFRAVCSHTAKSQNGDSISFEFFVGDGGDIEDSCGPYNFKDPGGINCDDPDEIEHPETRNRLVDLLYKPRKPKAK